MTNPEIDLFRSVELSPPTGESRIRRLLSRLGNLTLRDDVSRLVKSTPDILIPVGSIQSQPSEIATGDSAPWGTEQDNIPMYVRTIEQKASQD